jgi:hypothetical protein
VGPTPTLPPHQQPAATNRDRRSRRPDPRGDHDLVVGVGVDQPPTHAAAAAELERDGDQALEEAAVRLHHELAQAPPTIRPAAEPEPLGRRLPAPLDAAREGVER